jgi:two-component system sensor histidine kinase CpxA
VKSLFAKILLWLLATVVAAFLGFSIIEVRFDDAMRHAPMSRAFRFQGREAQEAYESGGAKALRWDLDRVKEIFQADAILTDAKGRDLITGADRMDLIRAGRWGDFLRRNRSVIARRSENGRYWFILSIPGQEVVSSFIPPEQLLVLAAVLVLCYLLAWYLTTPLRKLQTAIERFGSGDFSARAASTRSDELGQLARTFDQMAERIQNLVAADRRLLMDISHELRSPLARLGVSVELARTGANRDAALDRIQKESERLNALVGQLLQATRAEVDPDTRQTQAVRLDELVADVVNDGLVEATARGSAVKFEQPGPMTVSGDPELLRRASENVIRNAIRFAPPGTSVEVKLARDSGRVHLSVRDYGPGVPEDALNRIFDPFFRVEEDRNRSSGGVGLGLAIARRAVELHGGKLRASNAHPGLLVEMELPA